MRLFPLISRLFLINILQERGLLGHDFSGVYAEQRRALLLSVITCFLRSVPHSLFRYLNSAVVSPSLTFFLYGYSSTLSTYSKEFLGSFLLESIPDVEYYVFYF